MSSRRKKTRFKNKATLSTTGSAFSRECVWVQAPTSGERQRHRPSTDPDRISWPWDIRPEGMTQEVRTLHFCRHNSLYVGWPSPSYSSAPLGGRQRLAGQELAPHHCCPTLGSSFKPSDTKVSCQESLRIASAIGRGPQRLWEGISVMIDLFLHGAPAFPYPGGGMKWLGCPLPLWDVVWSGLDLPPHPFPPPQL